MTKLISTEGKPPAPSKSGFIALLGRPNAGKSTLLNTIIGEKISIISPRVQTTRHEIRGIYHYRDQHQFIFLDIPGIHQALDQLGQYCLQTCSKALEAADIITWLIDAYDPRQGDQFVLYKENLLILNILKEQNKPIIILITKIDQYRDFDLEAYQGLYDILPNIVDIIAISSVQKRNLDKYLHKCYELLPNAPHYYDDTELITDRDMRFHATETIREQLLLSLDEEIPHACTVQITEYLERPEQTTIRANIIAETKSQKVILIGKAGQMIKKIGIAAREQLSKNLETKVNLFLQVQVSPNWRKNNHKLQEYGYQ